MFDGVCNLCDGFVNFVADGDPHRRVKFGAQQKHGELLDRVGAPHDLSTVVVIQGDKFYTKSTAAMRTLALLEFPHRALAAFYVVPEPLRDFGYDLVAKYRYKVYARHVRHMFIASRPPAVAAIACCGSNSLLWSVSTARRPTRLPSAHWCSCPQVFGKVDECRVPTGEFVSHHRHAHLAPFCLLLLHRTQVRAMLYVLAAQTLHRLPT